MNQLLPLHLQIGQPLRPVANPYLQYILHVTGLHPTRIVTVISSPVIDNLPPGERGAPIVDQKMMSTVRKYIPC
jgi:hypothetical protein